ncbi:hypothetical protein [Candidatus Finniella inopinata]|uniref:Uncharacterized protein n=1 Tax=Candidatus Finniella inopinata TaxID=1696036 RepID=A0A4Q7DJP6_9PROT|nr:hypothetical protein [Candidatus Finniella inopinata]RZI46489.1 hypothetical protein EQU50_02575 [Candidatus Finniella inopinata]
MSHFSLSNFIVYLTPWRHVSTGLLSFSAVGFFVITGIIFQICLNQNLQVQAEFLQTTLEVESLQKQKQVLDQFEEIKKHMPQTFKAFKKSRFEEELTLDVMKSHFQRWQKLSKITSLNLKFGTQICHDSSLNLWRIPMVITLKVLKDTQFYDLLHRVQSQLPGKVILKQFSLKRTAALTPQMVEQITRDGKDINLFEGKIEFDWIHHETSKTKSAV